MQEQDILGGATLKVTNSDGLESAVEFIGMTVVGPALSSVTGFRELTHGGSDRIHSEVRRLGGADVRSVCNRHGRAVKPMKRIFLYDGATAVTSAPQSFVVNAAKMRFSLWHCHFSLFQRDPYPH